jgi:integrase
MPEPKKITLPDGRVRYQIVYDAGRVPKTDKDGKPVMGPDGQPETKRKQITRRFDRKKDAQAELARVGHQRAAGVYVPPAKLTVAQVIDNYLASAGFEAEAATRANYVHALRVPREFLGKRLAQTVTRQDIEALRDFMLTRGRKTGGKPGTGLGAPSVRLAIGRLSAAFEQAVQDKQLSWNPCLGVRLPKLAKPEKATWTADQAREFLTVAADDRLHAAWRLALYGLRREEICGLRWDGVDLDGGTLTVSSVRVVVNGAIDVKDTPKSQRSARTLPLDDALVAALSSLRKRQAAEKLAAGAAYTASGYVVVDEVGEPVWPSWLSNEFLRLVRRAGIPRVTLHGCRHTALSLMEKDGVPISVISRWAGHASAEFTYRVYVHAHQDDLGAGRDALSRRLGG